MSTLNVLLVEDSEPDAELLLAELRRHGFDPSAIRVDTQPALEAALASRQWDLVLSDHNMPAFSGTEALRIAKRISPDTPFIVVSGGIGEEHAVEAMRGGASDFIVKNKLYRLTPAVERELREAVHRLAQRRTAAALVESQNQLRQAQKLEALGRLAGGVTHDFNNLLTVILGFSDLVLGDLSVDDRHRSDIQEVRNAGAKAVELTRQLLAFSRQQVLDQTIVDLGGIVEDIARLLRRLIGEHIVLEIVAGPDLWRIRADRTQIDQIIMNLAVNAGDAMPTGGTLTIETANVLIEGDNEPQRPAQAGPYVMLRVHDTGVGIPEDILPSIFEPFFTTKNAGQGTGLGLSTVYGIVQQSNACLFVTSAPGKGTTFTTYFPQSMESVSSDREIAGVIAPRGNETVLLVEDEVGVRELTAKVLRQKGYHVIAAEGPDAAIRAVGDLREPVDLLLTDVVMPGMHGPQLAARLRETYPSLRVLLMSGFTSTTILGMDLHESRNVLAKPFTPSVLARRVGEALSTASP